MSQTDLSKPQATETGVIPGFGTAGGMTPQDVQLPRVVLTQAQSKAVADGNAPAGVFYDTLMGDVIGPTFDFVPVISYRNRVYLVMGEGLKCRSVDMEHGEGDPGGSCDQCPMKDWPEKGAKKKGPECNVSHNWLGLIVGMTAWTPASHGRKDQEVAAVEPIEPRIGILQWRSMATNAAKKLNGIHLNSSLMNVNARGWQDRVYRIGVELQRNDLGTFYVPTVKLTGLSDAAHKETAAFVKTALLGRDLVREVADTDDEATEF